MASAVTIFKQILFYGVYHTDCLHLHQQQMFLIQKIFFSLAKKQNKQKHIKTCLGKQTVFVLLWPKQNYSNNEILK